MRLPGWIAAAMLLPALGLVSGCHSYQVDTVVQNRSGNDVKLLEVDYPSAGFGTDVLRAGASYHYRFQIRGSGPVKVQYTEAKTLTVRQIVGPDLYEGQEGRLTIALLPQGKADFTAVLTPKH